MGERSVVVGAAVVRGDRVLACRRTRPADVAGGWELPGGKVEPGESPAAALVREVGEELGVAVAVTGWLDGAEPIGTSHVLRVAVVEVTRWTPRPVEHDRLRWLDGNDLDAVDWLPADRPFLPQLRALLRDRTRRTRRTARTP